MKYQILIFILSITLLTNLVSAQGITPLVNCYTDQLSHSNITCAGTIMEMRATVGQNINTFMFFNLSNYTGSNYYNFTYYITSIASSSAGVSANYFFCNDILANNTINWDNQDILVSHCDATPFASKQTNLFPTGLYSENITAKVLADSDKSFVIKIAPSANGTTDLIYGSKDNAVIGQRPLVNFSSISFIFPTPSNGDHNNNQATINFSVSSQANLTLFFDQNNPPTTLVAKRTNSLYLNWTTNAVAQGTYYYYGQINLSGILSNTSIQSWIYDTGGLGISLNDDNFFGKINNSNISRLQTNRNLSFNATDNIGLFGYEINITNSTGATMFYLINTTLTGTLQTVINNIPFANWTLGNYTAYLGIADSHTANLIKDYELDYAQYNTGRNCRAIGEQVFCDIMPIPNDLTIITENGYNLRMKSSSGSIILNKENDRYTMDFDTSGSAEMMEWDLHLSTDNKFRKIDDGFAGHIILYDDGRINGNWIDFVCDTPFETFTQEDSNVQAIDLVWLNPPENIHCQSIGGLNQYNVTYRFNLKSLTPFNTEIFFAGQRVFNYSNELPNAFNISNNTYINSALQAGCVCSGCSIVGTNCRIPITTHSDVSSIFQLKISNITSNYGIDNCSNSFNIPSNVTFNISTFNEKTATSINVNGSFNIYYSGIDFFNPENLYFTQYLSSTNKFTFCKYPLWADLGGNIVSTINSPTYQQLNFYRYFTKYNQNYNVYLLPVETTSNYITYIIQDSSTTSKRIQNALMKCYRIIEGNQVETQEGLSDVVGQILFYQDQLYRYDCSVNASGYPLKVFSLQPTLTTYVIQMNELGQTIDYEQYRGIRYKLNPSGNMFNVTNLYQNITFEFDGSNIEYFGMELTELTDCLPSCRVVSSSATGGNITISFNLSDTGIFYTHLFFKLTGQEEVTINAQINHAVYLQNTINSFVDLMEDIRNNTSPNTRVVLTGVSQAIVVGVAASIGIIGIGILYILLIMTIGLSIPAVGMIPPLYGLLTSIIIVVMIVYYSRYG